MLKNIKLRLKKWIINWGISWRIQLKSLFRKGFWRMRRRSAASGESPAILDFLWTVISARLLSAQQLTAIFPNRRRRQQFSSKWGKWPPTHWRHSNSRPMEAPNTGKCFSLQRIVAITRSFLNLRGKLHVLYLKIGFSQKDFIII